MATVSLGTQRTDRPQTPTLRQYYKGNGKLPIKSYVKTIFKPNKLPYWTIITDHDFKVVVSEDNPLHGVITDSIEQWEKDGSCLVITPDQEQIGAWDLGLDTDNNSTWRVMDWGYSLTDYVKSRKKKPT